MGRPGKRVKFHGNRFTTQSSNTSLDDSSSNLPRKPKSKRITYKIPRYGYTSRISAPRPQRKVDVQFKTDTDIKMIKASRPIGMRLLDIGILGEAMAKIRCTFCSIGYLSLFESECLHGWQTEFYLKCSSCQHLFAEFPSSKPMGMPKTSQFVNVQLPKQGLNEVTFLIWCILPTFKPIDNSIKVTKSWIIID